MFWPLFIVSRIVMVITARADHTDLNLALPLIAVSSVLEITVRRLALRFLSQWSFAVQVSAATVGNLFYAVCLVTDLRVLAAFGRPLDLQLFREGAAAMPVGTVLSLLTLRDWLFIAAALLTPITMLLWSRYREESFVPLRRRVVYYAVPMLIFAVGAFTYAAPLTHLVPALLRIPGLVVANALSGSPVALAAANRVEKPASLKLTKGRLPPVYHDENLLQNKTNLLVLVLESTGSRYVFDETLTLPGRGVPMPFLQKLSRESLYLSRHYSPSNTSPRALFSIFTGHYPEVSSEFFSLKRGLKIRGWNTYLPAETRFLVTPCATEWYFPNGLFRNNGISEIIGKSRLDIPERRTEPADARNEIQSADYFIQRLEAAKQPFFSVYISFAPHYPYHDYGPEWKVARGDTRLSQYVNNLRLLDAQIEKIFTALKNRGILENTVVVIAGDHSEAFYQHKGNFIHSLFSYEENLAVPALIHYPAGILPQQVSRVTTHADLGPTVLDLLKIRHAPGDFQGESLLRPENREQVFAYGNEGTVSVYGKDGVKLQLMKSGACQVFDLKTDSGETKPLPCTGYEALSAAAGQFVAGQMPHLTGLQAAVK